LESSTENIANENNDCIILYWSGRFPPLSLDDDTELYNARTVFYPDGKVEYTGYSYNQTVLSNEVWQVATENYEELMRVLSETGFFSLPQTFTYGAFDDSAETLNVYDDGEHFSTDYGPAGEGKEEDKESFSVLNNCCKAFKSYTTKP
jgi:hypothetical protein